MYYNCDQNEMGEELSKNRQGEIQISDSQVFWETTI